MRLTFTAALLAATALAGAASAETVVVTADRMLDVRAGRYVERPQITVTDGRITAVGRQGGALPTGARRIDLPGMTLLPGLIDMHVHLDGDPRYGGYRRLEMSDRFWPVIAGANARRTLEAGFTTVRNIGSRSAGSDVGVKEAVEAGIVTGPRIVPAYESFGATGGHCDETYLPASYDARNPLNADSAEAARRSVRTVRKYGAQVIKICATGGVFSRNTEPGAQQMSLAEMKAVAEEAHMQGLKVAAHAHGASGIKDAIRAGVDTIEHASLIDDEGIRMARAAGTWLSMDIYNGTYTEAEGRRNGVLEDNLRKDREITAVQRENFRRAHRAGVRMVFGTDASIYPHGDNARQFAVMVQFGMTPAEAIRTATVNAAEALGRQGEGVGEIAPGRWGDMIAVRGDPLADVRVLESVPVVLKGGALVKDAR
jgi:imidazolonepropionase-like amidohydrolase